MSNAPSRLLRAPLTAALLAAALLLPACSHPAQPAVDSNKALWAGKRPAKYQYSFHWSCFCSGDYTAPVKITVENDVVTKVTDAASGNAAAHPENYRTIDGLFSFLQDAIDRNADSITATYDATYGYPASVSIDYLKNAFDEEMAFTASDLVVLP